MRPDAVFHVTLQLSTTYGVQTVTYRLPAMTADEASEKALQAAVAARLVLHEDGRPTAKAITRCRGEATPSPGC
jgi:hypothetical protein